IETDLEILIPDSYVNNISERLQLYSRLDNIKNEEELKAFAEEVRDRFGVLPVSVEELINTVRLRWLGEQLGFEKLSLKNETLRATFISNNDKYFASETFGKIITYVQKHPRQFKMKDSGGKALLVIHQISTVDAAIEVLGLLAGQPSKSDKETISR